LALLESITTNPHAPITLEDAQHALRTGQWEDVPALRLVVKDAARAENFEKSKQWVMGWTQASALYQSPFETAVWPGTQVPRANVPFFTLATAVNGLTPNILSGLFYEDPPFLAQELPGTTSQQARAWSALIGFQLGDINFREECRLGITNVVLYGTAIWKWGWETFTKKRKLYVRNSNPVAIPNVVDPTAPPFQLSDDEDIEVETIEEVIDRPTFEHITNLGHVLVDPGLDRPDIRRAKYVVHRMYMTWNDLDKLRERPGYDIPSREKLLELFFPSRELPEADAGEMPSALGSLDTKSEPRWDITTEDPFEQPLEVLERWDNEKYIVVLQKKIVICNDDNPYGEIPFLSIGWWDVPQAFWSMGLSKTIGSEQRLQQGITNTWLDQASLNLNGVFVRVRGKNVQTQNLRISPGKIIEVDNPADFKPLDRTPAVPEAETHLSLSQARTELVSGAGEAATGVGGSSAHSNLARSAAGANLIGGGQASRVSDFVEKFSNQVFVPFIYHVMEMDKALLPVSTMKYILSEELQHEFMTKGPTDVIQLLNARVKIDISAGAKLATRRSMAQALPILTQFLQQPAVIEGLQAQGMKIDVKEVLRMLFESSDWKNYNDVIVPMSPEEIQQQQANSPAAAVAAKQQAQQQQMQAQYEMRSKLADEENMARAGREVLRQTLEKSTLPEALNDQPGDVGFGSSE
jgi:hypothetical protein